MNTKPYVYQLKGVRAIEAFNGRALLADQMGLGKSIQSLLYVYRNPHIKTTIIICPAVLKINWQRECSLHFSWHAEILESNTPKMAQLLKSRLLIINYEILHSWMDYLIRLNPDLVICDEAQAICNRSSRRSKAVRTLCKDVPHVIALSGTPLTNRPAELWNVLNIIRPDKFPSFFKFAFSWCNPKRTQWGWDFRGAGNLDKLHKTLKDILMVRRLKKDVLKELPDKIHSVIPIQITDRKEYDHALHDFIGWLIKTNPTKLSAAQKAQRIVQMGALKQLAGKLKLKNVIKWIDTFLEESDKKLILFAVHTELIALLNKHYKNISVVVNGKVRGAKRQQAIDQFNKHTKTRLLIGNVVAAGKGWSCKSADDGAFVEFPWTPDALAQASDRVHGIGRGTGNSRCHIHYLVGEGTIEEDLLKLIQRKQRILTQVLDGGKIEKDLDIYDQLTQVILEQRRK
jgi:SWI/SNF-related matrix-associated actin-dependent regulator 1 of chromatin subfamily A